MAGTMYHVTAPLVQARLEDGTYAHVYEGGVLPEGVDKAQIEQLVAGGMVSTSGAEAPEDDRPAGNASRDAWAEYAQANGRDVTDEMSRDDIRALFE